MRRPTSRPPPDEQTYEIVVTVVNGTTNPIGSSLISAHATADTVPAEPIYLDGLTARTSHPGS